jgi:hypothetical protein
MALRTGNPGIPAKRAVHPAGMAVAVGMAMNLSHHSLSSLRLTVRLCIVALASMAGAEGCGNGDTSTLHSSCSTNDECSRDQVCLADPVGTPKTCEVGCRSDADCGAGERCSPDSICGPGCNVDADCGAGEWCSHKFAINLGRVGPSGACAPLSLPCGSATCDVQNLTTRGIEVRLGACCTADDACGLVTAVPLPDIGCQALAQRGVADTTCPSQKDILGTEYPGCRRVDGTCGAQVGTLGDPASLGCIVLQP